MQDPKITEAIRKWLYDKDSRRNTLEGAELLLKINRNRIFYDSVVRFPKKYHERLVYELEKNLKARMQTATEEQLSKAMSKVERIVSTGIVPEARNSVTDKSRIIHSKRSDHDDLPLEIQRMWVDNADITRKIRECHTKIRLINGSNSSCPDSDRLMYAREMIDLYRKLKDNYYTYDHYKPGDPVSVLSPPMTPKQASRRAEKLINLNKKRYEESKDPELADRIREWYGTVISPTSKMTDDLISLGIINDG